MNTTTASATQRAYDHILEQLHDRELRPGTRLVTRNLAKELGTSLNPVREALNRLSSQGWLEHIPGSGTFVHQPDAQRIRDLYGFREAIESHAAAEATRHITPHDLALLKDICTNWRQRGTRMREQGIACLGPVEREEWAREEERFHSALVAAAGNAMLTRSVTEQRVLSTMFESHCEIEMQVTVEIVEHVAATHAELIAAIEARDADRARKITASMLRVGCDEVLAHLEKRQP